MVAFEAEVKQAGIFTVANMQEAQIEHAKKHFVQIFFTIMHVRQFLI